MSKLRLKGSDELATNDLLRNELEGTGVLFVSEQDLLEQDFIMIAGFLPEDARTAAQNVLNQQL